jgi:hypothetical protein
MRRPAFLTLAALALAGCTLSSGSGSTPTLTSDEVIQTAQAGAQQTRQAYTPTATRVVESPTPSAPALSATPESSATPTSALATADQTANVRTGPGTAFDWVDFLYQGQSAEIVGRYESDSEGTWWFIHRVGQGLDGWVWGGVITTSGDLSGVPFLVSPPTPTPGPSPTPVPSTATSTPQP